MSELLGLAILLMIAAVATVLILSGIIAHAAVHPPRRTAGYAVAHGLPADPGDLGLEFESWQLDLQRDVKLPVWEITARSHGTGTGPSAVFVHGWGESRLTMLKRIDPWLDHVKRIVLYDRRGHGDATGSNARLGTGEHHDVLALLDRLGDGPSILVGYGSGAAVAIAAAAHAASDATITAVATYNRADDMRASTCDRLRARGLPTRPLTDFAMLWLRLIGIRTRGPRPAGRDLQCPVLIDPDVAAIPT